MGINSRRLHKNDDFYSKPWWIRFLNIEKGWENYMERKLDGKQVRFKHSMFKKGITQDGLSVGYVVVSGKGGETNLSKTWMFLLKRLQWGPPMV